MEEQESLSENQQHSARRALPYICVRAHVGFAPVRTSLMVYEGLAGWGPTYHGTMGWKDPYG